jgi:ParB-like chromosome segregation protein Spo0J
MGNVGLMGHGLVEQGKALAAQVGELPPLEQVAVINEIKRALHAVSPLRDEPVDCVLWVPAETVEANDYNPNKVAPPEMKLLEHSIREDGYTQPVVTWLTNGDDSREVVDGFHRCRIGRECKAVHKRTLGLLPVTTINTDREGRSDRISATIRHNRARGKHQVQAMSEIVVELTKRCWSDEKIGRELGMEPDEVLRLKQISGLAEMFADREFSEAWEVDYDSSRDQGPA